MTTIIDLIRRIESGEVLEAITFNKFDVAIEDRYVPEFEKPWMSIYNELCGVHLDQSDQTNLDQLREIAYLRAFEVTGDPEISGLVSDDFDLIGKALIGGKNFPWLNGLWLEYKTGSFPVGRILEDKRPLQALM